MVSQINTICDRIYLCRIIVVLDHEVVALLLPDRWGVPANPRVGRRKHRNEQIKDHNNSKEHIQHQEDGIHPVLKCLLEPASNWLKNYPFRAAREITVLCVLVARDEKCWFCSIWSILKTRNAIFCPKTEVISFRNLFNQPPPLKIFEPIRVDNQTILRDRKLVFQRL